VEGKKEEMKVEGDIAPTESQHLCSLGYEFYQAINYTIESK